MKKILYISMIFIIIFSLFTGCNSTTNKTTKEENNSPKQNVASQNKVNESIYTASDDFDEHGWKAQLEITCQDGKIIKVLYSEVNKEGTKKIDVDEYAEKMKKQSGITPKEAQETLQTSLIKTQDPDKVDVVSGATSTSKRFISLAKKAMAQKPE